VQGSNPSRADQIRALLTRARWRRAACGSPPRPRPGEMLRTRRGSSLPQVQMRPISSPRAYRPPLVISVHGIRTAARWQKSLSDTLGLYSVPHRAYDFGRFSLSRFAWNRSRQRIINDFYDFYGDLVREQLTHIHLDDYRSRPSIIAHSFGSYIIGYAMQKYSDIRFDKVILCGSVLPVDFDWSTLFHRDQVNFVRNEYGCQGFLGQHCWHVYPKYWALRYYRLSSYLTERALTFVGEARQKYGQ
jgi:pimeloyl-ACP methyl ester carboxylesterase